MSKLSYEAKLFWIFKETQSMNLNKSGENQATLAIVDEKGQSSTYTGTMPQVIDAAFQAISADAESDVAEEKAREFFSRMTFGLVDGPLEHAAEEALYEQASS
ncbi:TPA: hypothetical protein ACOEOW_003906 [Enterobacter hormaechei subsp. xiangfangensis]